MNEKQIREQIVCMAQRARAASFHMAAVSSIIKDRALKGMAEEIEADASEILKANERDIAAAKEKGLSAAIRDKKVTYDLARLMEGDVKPIKTSEFATAIIERM